VKVAKFYKPGEMLHIEDAEKPITSVGYAVVRMRAAGVCGTELHFLRGMVDIKKPLILGHEMAGDIESVFDGADYKPGDRVVIYTMMNCGYCHFCCSAMESLCENRTEQMGFSIDGGFAEYVKVPLRNLIPVPQNVSYQDASVLACGGMTAVHAVRLAGIGFGQKVVINGIGGVGIMAIQVCRVAGASIIAIADDEERARLARMAGADNVICTANFSKVGKIVKEHTNGQGTEFFIDLVGNNNSVNAGLDSLAKRGKLIIIGYTEEDLHISPSKLVHGELQILSSLAASKKDLSDAIDMAGRQLIKPIIDQEFSLAEINEALRRLENREVYGRNVIVFP